MLLLLSLTALVMTQRRLHKHASISGHNQSLGDVFEQGEGFLLTIDRKRKDGKALW